MGGPNSEGRNNIKICALTTISKTMDWFIVDNMRNLSAHGYDVTLICNMDDGFAARNSDYARCINLNMSRGADLFGLFLNTFRLWKIFRAEKFDLLYYTSPNVSMYAALAGKLAGVKTRVYSQCGLRYVSFAGLRRMIFKFIEKLTCGFSTHVRAQSPKNMQFAITEKLCRAHKISVVGIGGTTGVDLKECDKFDHKETRGRLRRSYGVPANAFVYGYVGRVNADKGINELITAFHAIQREIPNACLILVGMIDDTNPVDAATMASAKTNEQIVFTGNVPPDQVYQHMAMFDVLTHPTYREGFGKALQEAMGMRLPIITTNVPGPSEVVEDGISGILAEVKNPDDLAEKMKIIYTDKALRDRLAYAGRRRAEQYFDRPTMLGNLLTDLNQIMGIE